MTLQANNKRRRAGKRCGPSCIISSKWLGGYFFCLAPAEGSSDPLCEGEHMSDLSQETCEACRFDAPRVRPEERQELGAQIPDWQTVTVDDVERLRREFKLKDYKAALAFTNAIADMAEAENHHPLIVLEWGKVTVEWWTHKISGLHRNDFISAAKTDRILAELSA